MSKLKAIIKFLLIGAAVSAVLGCLSLLGLYLYLEPKLPEIDVLHDVHLQEPLRVYASDGKLIAEYGEARRIPLSEDEIPKMLKQAFIASEDDRFYAHPGVDWQGLVRAALVWATTGNRAQGGSTITMQVARNFFLTKEKTIIRKVNEILLALKITRELSKEKVLELYLNKIFLGKRAYGVAAAAKVYYDKTVDELSLPEMAMIAGLPKAPSSYNPIARPQRAVQRRNYVLGRMLALDMIDQEAYELAKVAPITAKVHVVRPEVEAGYVGEMVRARIVEMYPGEAYTGGFKVYTTIDSRQQVSASLAMRQGLLRIDQRHGFRGVIAHLDDVIDKEGAVDYERADAVLAKYNRKAGLRSALVQAVDKESALLYFSDEETAALDLEGVAWARKYVTIDRVGAEIKKVSDVLKPGDVVWVRLDEQGKLALAQMPEVEGALVALDPASGAVTALVGGFDYFKSKFNRAVQAQRQAGSSFKPFLYASALHNGYTPASVVNDAPVVFDDPALESKWKPENYSGKFYGPTRLRVALANSRNLVSIRLLIDQGVSRVRRFASEMGFNADRLPRDLSLALGSGTVTPYELVGSFSIFANGGYQVEPFYIDRVENAAGEVLFEAPYKVACLACLSEQAQSSLVVEGAQQETGEVEDAPEEGSVTLALPELASEAGEAEVQEQAVKRVTQAERVMDEREVFLIRSMLQDVVRRGTARRALQLGRTDLAGKTGTTNDQIDAWFTGFNDHVVASVWVGYDDLKTMGRRETGSSAALPIWVDFMRGALDGVGNSTREQPEGVVSVRIDPKTGLLAGPEQADAVFEYFRHENIPTEVAVPEEVLVYGEDDAAEPVEELF